MSLKERIASWIDSNAKQFVLARIPEPEPAVALVPDQAYVGLWLSHGFLDRDVKWFERRYPVVHASARLDVAGAATTLTKLARPAEGMVGPGVWLDYEIAGLAPYRGGSVELEAGLSALERSSYARAAVDVLVGLSALLAPPLSTVGAIAGAVGNGVQKVVEAGGEDIELGLHETLTAPGGGGSNELAPGHLAVVKATRDQVDPASLRVGEDSRLQVARDGGAVPLEGYSYLLFRVEARRTREGWRFPRFDELIGKAIDAHFAGDADGFAGYRNAVLAEVLKSPDLTAPDRFRIARAVAAELREVTEMGHGAIAAAPTTLAEIADRAAPIDDPVATSEVGLSTLLEDEGSS